MECKDDFSYILTYVCCACHKDRQRDTNKDRGSGMHTVTDRETVVNTD